MNGRIWRWTANAAHAYGAAIHPLHPPATETALFLAAPLPYTEVAKCAGLLQRC
jgi:hypothetical protein